MTNEQDNRQWINPILFKTAQLNKKNWETEKKGGPIETTLYSVHESDILKYLGPGYMRRIYKCYGDVRVFSSLLRKPIQF